MAKTLGGMLLVVVALLFFGCTSDDETGTIYTIQDKDSLKSLAAEYYGDSAKWPAIWLGTNTQALVRNELVVLVDPETLTAGDKIWIPTQSDAARLIDLWSKPGTYIATRCWDTIKSYGKAECGYLVTPEDHDQSGNGKTVQIAVAVVKSTAAQPAADPVFLLEGGPGVSGVLTLYADRILQFLETRDVVLIDQRGMGHSQPGLFCQTGETTAACKERLVNHGVDLSLFHTSAIAEDIEMLRQTLGLNQINLFAFSYGTFLAQELLRRHPEGVRSAILDSCLPVSVATKAEGGPGAIASFRKLIADCAADTACQAACPDLENSFYSVLEQANTTPFSVTLNGETQSVGPGMLVTSVLMALNTPSQLVYVPAAIKALTVSDTASTALATVLKSEADNRTYLDCQGAKISVQCHDMLPFETYAQAETSNSALNSYVAANYNMFAKTGHDQCGTWDIETAEASFHQPASCSVPSLVLGGQYDTLTRAEWGQLVADAMSKAYYFAVPRTGHVVIQRDCPLNMVKAFLADPSKAPDASCLEEIGGDNFFWLP